MPRHALAILAALVLGACPRDKRVEPVQSLYGSTATLAGERATDGTVKDRLVQDDAKFVLFYASEQKGSLEPCGCPREPRGSIPRLQTYLDASVAANPDTPWLLVNAGYFLEDVIGLGGQLREDVPLTNRWMVRGLAAQGTWAAINVGYTDLPGLVDLGEAFPDLPLVSANVTAREPGVPAIEPWISAQAGDLVVGITGITAAGISFVPTPQYGIEPPVPAVEAVLEQMADEVDVVVLLAFQAIEEARALAEDHPEITVVVDAYHHHESVPPFLVGDAIWVKSHHQTQRLGELRLWVDQAGIDRALDRQIDLDPDIPGDTELTDIMVRARQEIELKAKELWGP